jgi:hypothetical protein
VTTAVAGARREAQWARNGAAYLPGFAPSRSLS